jgi:hypothetical protein
MLFLLQPFTILPSHGFSIRIFVRSPTPSIFQVFPNFRGTRIFSASVSRMNCAPCLYIHKRQFACKLSSLFTKVVLITETIIAIRRDTFGHNPFKNSTPTWCQAPYKFGARHHAPLGAPLGARHQVCWGRSVGVAIENWGQAGRDGGEFCATT